MHSKILQDSVHGQITLDAVAVAIIDTVEFQRLRGLHQTGHVYFVFPGCHHTRFEHSVGTYHLANRLLNAIEHDSNYKGPIPSQAVQMAVKLAALTHDLGHGPFSHFWEAFVHKGGAEYREYKHELISCHVLDRLVSRNPKVAQLLKDNGVDVGLIKRLILGKPSDEDKVNLKDVLYVFEILSNQVNGMDVDKWEYLQRDYYQIGQRQNIDVERLLHFFRPVYVSTTACSMAKDDPPNGESGSWHLAFRETELENIIRIFYLRKHLHCKFFFHKTVVTIEAMIHDMLDLVEPILHLRETSLKAFRCADPQSLDSFLRLSDTILWDIYHGSSLPPIPAESTTLQSNLSAAQHIYNCVLTRDFYHLIAEVNTRCDLAVGVDRFTSRTSWAGHASDEQTVKGMSNSLTGEQLRNALLTKMLEKLPSGSETLLTKNLLVITKTISSNSTHKLPLFYFYNNRTGEVYKHQEPLQSFAIHRVIWRQPRSELSTVEQLPAITKLVCETMNSLKEDGVL